MSEEMCRLGAEYEKAINVQKDVIGVNLDRLSNAFKTRDHAEVKRLRSVLAILYDEKRELEDLSRELNGYLNKN